MAVGVLDGSGVLVGVKVGNRVGSGLAVGVGCGVSVGRAVSGICVFISIWGGSATALKPKQEDVKRERTNKTSRIGGIRFLFVIFSTGKTLKYPEISNNTMSWDFWMYPKVGIYT